MLPTEKKLRTQASEEFDIDSVELNKSPKRVLRSGKVSLGRTKKRNTDASAKEKPLSSSSKGTRKPLLPLPWDSREKPEKNSSRKSQKIKTLGTGESFSSEFRISGKDGPRLFEALKVPVGGADSLNLTQGFHTYPQRLHPHIPQTLLKQEPKGGLLFDPFMGSGTVLLEGLLKGLKVVGSDLNPMASLIARERCRWLSLRNAQRVWTEVESIRQSIESEKLGRRLVSHSHSKWLKNLYPPHLLVEMLHWFDRIRQLQDPAIMECLRMVFSSLVYRFTPDSGESRGRSRVPRGQFGRTMSERTQTLIRAQTVLAEKIRHADPPELKCRDFLEIQSEELAKADLLISRPPFPGSARQLRGQELLLKWMGLYDKNFQSRILGTEADFLKRNWIPRFRRMMLNMRHSTTPGGKCYLYAEDWLERDRREDALEFMKKFSRSEGWTLDSTASRRIPSIVHEQKAYETTGKWESLVLLRN